MHTHLVAAAVWRYRQGLPTEALLRRIAHEELVLVSTGASDWLESSGSAERVDGGYAVTARKVFGSGSPAGDLLVTSAPLDDPTDGPTVLHFPVAMAAPGVTVLDNWRAMGMRGTGSNDVLLENVFVPDHAITLRRPRGQWHPFFNLNVIVAMPLVMSAYLGIATAARDIAIQHARKRSAANQETWYLLGELVIAYTTARLAVEDMVATCADYAFVADNATANKILVCKSIAAQSMLATVEKCLRTVGGSGMFTSVGLERLLRDIHGAEFHPLQEKRQHRLTGRVLLGLDPA
jgi:alkylation response protein AidB-like acyl-CoA dehydrogenase